MPNVQGSLSPMGVCPGNAFSQGQDSLNLAFVNFGSSLMALDGGNGSLKWQYVSPQGTHIDQLSGWNDTMTLLLHGQPIHSSYSPIPTIPTVIVGLDASTGTPKWKVNGSNILPLTQAETSNYYVDYLVTGEDVSLFSRAGRLAALSNQNGTLMWTTHVYLDGNLFIGQPANITHVRYIPRIFSNNEGLTPSPPRLLINADNWGFQRFVLLTMNDTNVSSPATATWRSKFPETAINELYFTQPIVDSSPSGGNFYYWSNRTDWVSGTTPTSKVYLVGRSLSDGSQLWQLQAGYAGLPSVYHGRVMVVTTQGLLALDGTTGSAMWNVPQSPPMQYSYSISPTFGNTTGVLVASRCLGQGSPSLCMYSAFASPPSGATGRHSLYPVLLTALCLSFSLIFTFQ